MAMDEIKHIQNQIQLQMNKMSFEIAVFEAFIREAFRHLVRFIPVKNGLWKKLCFQTLLLAFMTLNFLPDGTVVLNIVWYRYGCGFVLDFICFQVTLFPTLATEVVPNAHLC